MILIIGCYKWGRFTLGVAWDYEWSYNNQGFISRHNELWPGIQDTWVLALALLQLAAWNQTSLLVLIGPSIKQSPRFSKQFHRAQSWKMGGRGLPNERSFWAPTSLQPMNGFTEWIASSKVFFFNWQKTKKQTGLVSQSFLWIFLEEELKYGIWFQQ